jgi:very-short-patch-repair endonuclease
MGRINAKISSKRMKEKNPMWMPGVLDRMKKSMKGKKFVQRGGNGYGPTIPQQILFNALLVSGLKPSMEQSIGIIGNLLSSDPQLAQVQTGLKNYRVDVAIPHFKLAIEIDGHSHGTLLQKTRDAWKTRRLNALGWTVLRFWNSQVTAHLVGCVQTVMSTISRLKTTTTILPMAS